MAREISRTDAFRRRLATLCAAGLTLAALSLDIAVSEAQAQGQGAASQPAARPVINAHPTWNELSATHKAVLAPLQPLWDTIPELNRHKWQRIADLYPKLKPEEQKRLQERMAEWVKMTPQQRRLARENYQITRSLPAETKADAWDRYQQLPDEQKKKLAAAEKVPKHPGAVSALPSGKRPPSDTSRQLHRRDAKPASEPEVAPASTPGSQAVAAASAPIAPAPASAPPPAATPAPAAPQTLSPPVTGEAATDFNPSSQSDSQRQ